MLCELASTTTMFAPGAMACDHSTSSDSSSVQPLFVCAVALTAPPDWFTTVSLGLGRPVSLVKRLEVGGDRGIVVRLDQGDGLARTVALHALSSRIREADCVQTVGSRHLGRSQAGKQAAIVEMINKRTEAQTASAVGHGCPRFVWMR